MVTGMLTNCNLDVMPMLRVENIVEKKKDYKRMAQTQRQFDTCEALFENYNNINFIGRTNQNNLVFQIGKNQIKVTPYGRII